MERKSAGPDSAVEGLDVGAALEALADERRREAIRVLDPCERATIEELAIGIVAMPDASTRDLDRVVVDLHHRTLPKLDDLGVVRYDLEASLVEPTDALADLVPLLEYVEYTGGMR